MEYFLHAIKCKRNLKVKLDVNCFLHLEIVDHCCYGKYSLLWERTDGIAFSVFKSLLALGTRVKGCHLFVLLNEVKIVVRKLGAMTAIVATLWSAHSLVFSIDCDNISIQLASSLFMFLLFLRATITAVNGI